MFTVLFAALTHVAARRRVDVPSSTIALGEGLLATFFVTRMIAHEKVGSVVREPFVEPAPGTDPADAHGAAKQPTGHGVRFAIGELVTCTRCLGPWVAAAVTFGHLLAPRHARIVTRIAAIAGANIAAHAAFAALTARSEPPAPAGDE